MTQSTFYLCSIILTTLTLVFLAIERFSQMTKGGIVRLCISLGAAGFLAFSIINFTKPRITPENSESYILDWSTSLHLLSRKLPDDEKTTAKAFWGYAIGTRPENMITVWHPKERAGAYLTFSKNIVLPNQTQALLKMMPKHARDMFRMEYNAEIAKSRMLCTFDEMVTRIDIDKSVAVAGLDELTFVNLLNEMLQNEQIAAQEVPLCMIRAVFDQQVMMNPASDVSSLATPTPTPAP